MSDKLIAIVEDYFSELRKVRGLGAGTPERSYYPAFSALLNRLGAELRPKVLCLSDMANTGAGHPDFGLYAANQIQKGEPRRGQTPERGVIEMKGTGDDAWFTAETVQVSKYVEAYSLVIVTNLRDFLIVAIGAAGKAVRLESFRLADSAKAFWDMVATPRKSAERIGPAFGEYLRRALTQSVALREPRDVAWFIASYARDALQRVTSAGDLPALASVRMSLEQALGVQFEPDKGDHFFRSTLVQTLFYGVFSAWVLWARQVPRTPATFDWHTAIWHLNVPFVRSLFQQIASPAHLHPLRLVEVLDWTGATLNRIPPDEFFKRFNDTDAVQFFYEPFLEAFDPDLRKDLGVWYTPTEVVTYMVAQVDNALRHDLGIADGLASDQVYILDPCCGTGAFLSAVLRRIDSRLAERGLGALRSQMVKKAALERVFGFELMPAPFVVAHLKVGLVLQGMGAPLDADHERVGVYLTNALTGWEPFNDKPLPYPELEDERKRAGRVKRDTPILVILGNPPYNGFAGMAVEEERGLSHAYRTTKQVRRPEGQGLNDLYVRFFRMAERRIVEKTGQGIVSFISNYSWLDGLSFTGMRERYLEAFDIIRIDCLNGDKYKTGKTTPDGKPDPSIFSTEHNREGIQVGTAIATLVRKPVHAEATEVSFRNLWGTDKRERLLATAETDAATLYSPVVPPLQLGLSFVAASVSMGYFDWPRLPELLPVSFPGVKTSRDDFLVSIDRDVLEARVDAYFDSKITDDDIKRRYRSVMASSGRFDPVHTRQVLQHRGKQAGKIVRYAYRPFDVRWVYWDPDSKLLDEKRTEFQQQVKGDNLFLSAGARNRKEDFYQPQVSARLADHHLVESNVGMFPLFLDHGADTIRPNLPASLQAFISARQLDAATIFYHTVAILHAELYRTENSGALRMDWPRVPLPSDTELLRRSAELGAKIARLLNTEAPASGPSASKQKARLNTLATPHKSGGGALGSADLELTVGWGSVQTTKKGATLVMPGRGLTAERDYTVQERDALEQEGKALGLSLEGVLQVLGSSTVDVHLNANACWLNVPAKIWAYELGGYQVIKKYLSYREHAVLGRALTPDEVAYVSEMVRRIGAILLLGPALDANYVAAKACAVAWENGRPIDTASA